MGPVETAVRAELAGHGESALSALALALARHLDSGPDARQVAALHRELRLTLADLRATAADRTGGVDDDDDLSGLADPD